MDEMNDWHLEKLLQGYKEYKDHILTPEEIRRSLEMIWAKLEQIEFELK